MSQYPEDEFDLAAKDRGPKGVHRPAEKLSRKLLPWIVVILAAPLLAWGAIELIGGGSDSETSPTAASTSAEQGTDASSASDAPTTESAEPTTESAEPTTESAEPTTAEETTEPEPAVEYATPISVLNGAGVSGLAGRVSETLTAAGFTAVTAGNYQSAQPTTSAVFYRTVELADTAQAVADELGITAVSQLDSASADIVVVLRSDFSE